MGKYRNGKKLYIQRQQGLKFKKSTDITQECKNVITKFILSPVKLKTIAVSVTKHSSCD